MSTARVKIPESDLTQKSVKAKQRHLRIIDEKKTKPADFFYRISNPGQMARIGQTYLEDFKNGIKSFVITSTDYKSSQQRTVLALASYFDHLYDMKILIISDTLENGVFQELMQAKKVEKFKAEGVNQTIDVNRFYHHFSLVDLNQLLSINKDNKNSYDFEVMVETLLGEYDIVFWDTPIINTARNISRVYNQTMSYFDSLTIIVSPNVSRAGDLNGIKQYFSNMGVNIKGVLFDYPSQPQGEGLRMTGE